MLIGTVHRKEEKYEDTESYLSAVILLATKQNNERRKYKYVCIQEQLDVSNEYGSMYLGHNDQIRVWRTFWNKDKSYESTKKKETRKNINIAWARGKSHLPSELVRA